MTIEKTTIENCVLMPRNNETLLEQSKTDPTAFRIKMNGYAIVPLEYFTVGYGDKVRKLRKHGRQFMKTKEPPK